MTFQYDVIGSRYSGAYPGVLINVNNPHEIDSGLPNATTPPTRYGDPVVYDNSTNTFRPVLGTDTSATVIAGFLIKPFAQTSTDWPYSNNAITFPEVPSPTQTLNILRKGTIAVYVCNAAAKPPVEGQPVYAQIIAYGSGATAIPVGAISAFAEGTSGADAFAIPGATWATSGVDANGFGAVRYA